MARRRRTRHETEALSDGARAVLVKRLRELGYEAALANRRRAIKARIAYAAVIKPEIERHRARIKALGERCVPGTGKRTFGEMLRDSAADLERGLPGGLYARMQEHDRCLDYLLNHGPLAALAPQAWKMTREGTKPADTTWHKAATVVDVAVQCELGRRDLAENVRILADLGWQDRLGRVSLHQKKQLVADAIKAFRAQERREARLGKISRAAREIPA